MRGYFGPDSTTWKIGSEAVITLAGARAVLLQIAHPLVAQAVGAHSSYMSDPVGRMERTFILSQMLLFGSTQTAHQAARTINGLHTHVHGTLPAAAGDHASGSLYDAQDPELLLWVHATLIDTVLLAYPLFVGPLSLEEQEKYYQESKILARLLGLSPAAMPATAADLRQYVHAMINSNRLAATPQARHIARQVLFPSTLAALKPLTHLNAQVTCALLPPSIREMYDLRWSAGQQRAFELATATLRTIIPQLPISLRTFPITRKMRAQTST